MSSYTSPVPPTLGDVLLLPTLSDVILIEVRKRPIGPVPVQPSQVHRIWGRVLEWEELAQTAKELHVAGGAERVGQHLLLLSLRERVRLRRSEFRGQARSPGSYPRRPHPPCECYKVGCGRAPSALAPCSVGRHSLTGLSNVGHCPYE